MKSATSPLTSDELELRPVNLSAQQATELRRHASRNGRPMPISSTSVTFMPLRDSNRRQSESIGAAGRNGRRGYGAFDLAPRELRLRWRSTWCSMVRLVYPWRAAPASPGRSITAGTAEMVGTARRSALAL